MDENLPDSITRSIDIDAPAERVWALVSEPGWFINDGEYRVHRIEVDGGVATVHDPVHGAFALRTETLEPPRYAAFRWLGGTPGGGADTQEATLVEFRIEDLRGGGVRLTVTESGFAGLPGSADERRRAVEENSAGWDQELQVARSHLAAA
ncbi:MULTISPECIES: SRPBCC domain-containing protein [unclassified Arthrobacter]|uniref:SRPBCC domain-containing protein n=1 Tax=unclassified Arthrobacter TaxID=235627 RepID=UPI003561DCA9